MAPDAAQLVEPSPTEILASLTPNQTAKWRQTGELPEAKPKEETKAESSPAATTAVTETPAKAAETTAAPVTAQEPPKAKGAEARIKELLADNKRLASELETLRTKPVIVPAKIEEPAKPHRNELDEKTGQPKFATEEAFDSAYERWMTEKVGNDVRKQIAKEAETVRIAEQNKLIEQRMQNSLEMAKQKYPDFLDVLKAETKDGKTVFNAEAVKAIKQNGVLDAWILDSEVGSEILYHLCKNPSEVGRIQALNPFSAARELTKLEDKLSGTPTSTLTPKPEEKPAPTNGNVTRAPAPAASISGKATAPTDEVGAALEAEDFKRYAEAANAEEFKRRKGK